MWDTNIVYNKTVTLCVYKSLTYGIEYSCFYDSNECLIKKKNASIGFYVNLTTALCSFAKWVALDVTESRKYYPGL